MSLAKGISADELLYNFLGRSAKNIFSRKHYLRYIFGLRSDYSSDTIDSIYKFLHINKDN